MLSLIVAKGKNNVIGNNNKLIWKLPEDLKRFKELTSGHIIIMGRKTFESLGRVLPNRKHIVFTTNKNFKVLDENVKIVYSLSEIQKYIDSSKECFVIGGASIYKLLIPYISKMYITNINEEFEGDAFFPKIDINNLKEIKREKGIRNEKNNYDYDFITYERIK